MNHIHALKMENAGLRAQRDNLLQSFQAFRCFLRSAKFSGEESNGERKDWIATADLFRWMEQAESEAQAESDNARAEAMRAIYSAARAAMAEARSKAQPEPETTMAQV